LFGVIGELKEIINNGFGKLRAGQNAGYLLKKKIFLGKKYILKNFY
jgi:hypothetical protein